MAKVFLATPPRIILRRTGGYQTGGFSFQLCETKAAPAGSDWKERNRARIADSIAILCPTRIRRIFVCHFRVGVRFGKRKDSRPLKLESCKVHPRLEPIQYSTFQCPARFRGVYLLTPP